LPSPRATGIFSPLSKSSGSNLPACEEVYDLLLSGAERGIAEHVVKDLGSGWAHGGSLYEPPLADIRAVDSRS